MKVIHIEGGLGNQMACYSVYIATKIANPNDELYIDTYVYDIKESHKVISMWNGYELNRVFGFNAKDIRSLFSEDEVQGQIGLLRESKYWEHGWDYSNAFIEVMKEFGLELGLAYGKVGEDDKGFLDIKAGLKKLFRKYGSESAKNRLEYETKRIAHRLYHTVSADCGKYLLENRSGNLFYDITLDYMKSNFLQEKIGDEVRDGLRFAGTIDSKNKIYFDLIENSESVSIHVRRTDYLAFNDDCYQYGYFQKCTNYIRRKVKEPFFFVFSDDMIWCRNNFRKLGLRDNDTIYYVEINKAEDSYRDMWLMSKCKYNIATKSSFGWWAGYLNNYPNKITCCQLGEYVVTKQF